MSISVTGQVKRIEIGTGTWALIADNGQTLVNTTFANSNTYPPAFQSYPNQEVNFVPLLIYWRQFPLRVRFLKTL